MVGLVTKFAAAVVKIVACLESDCADEHLAYQRSIHESFKDPSVQRSEYQQCMSTRCEGRLLQALRVLEPVTKARLASTRSLGLGAPLAGIEKDLKTQRALLRRAGKTRFANEQDARDAFSQVRYASMMLL
jgi:hypothetical protein